MPIVVEDLGGPERDSFTVALDCVTAAMVHILAQERGTSPEQVIATVVARGLGDIADEAMMLIEAGCA